MPEEQQYILEDLGVVSVGLVDRAAVSLNEDGGGPTGENFIILKNEEGQMPDEVTIEEVADEQTPDEQTESTGDVENPETVETEDAGQGEPEVTEAVAKSLFERVKELFKSEQQPQVENTESAEENMTDQTQAQPGLELETVLKAVEERFAVEKAAMAKEVEVAKAEAQRANERADKADADREKREWLEKADRFTLVLPGERQEVADHLYAIAKAAPDEAKWLVEYLKAADHQLTEAGFFREAGTTQTPEELTIEQEIEEIMKSENVSYTDALMRLPKEKQQMLNDKRQQRVKGGK